MSKEKAQLLCQMGGSKSSSKKESDGHFDHVVNGKLVPGEHVQSAKIANIK